MLCVPCCVCHAVCAMFCVPCSVCHAVCAMLCVPCCVCHAVCAMHWLFGGVLHTTEGTHVGRHLAALPERVSKSSLVVHILVFFDSI